MPPGVRGTCPKGCATSNVCSRLWLGILELDVFRDTVSPSAIVAATVVCQMGVSQGVVRLLEQAVCELCHFECHPGQVMLT